MCVRLRRTTLTSPAVVINSPSLLSVMAWNNQNGYSTDGRYHTRAPSHTSTHTHAHTHMHLQELTPALGLCFGVADGAVLLADYLFLSGLLS